MNGNVDLEVEGKKEDKERMIREMGQIREKEKRYRGYSLWATELWNTYKQTLWRMEKRITRDERKERFIRAREGKLVVLEQNGMRLGGGESVGLESS